MLVDRISQGMHAHRCLLEKMKPALVVGSSAQSVSALACYVLYYCTDSDVLQYASPSFYAIITHVYVNHELPPNSPQPNKRSQERPSDQMLLGLSLHSLNDWFLALANMLPSDQRRDGFIV